MAPVACGGWCSIRPCAAGAWARSLVAELIEEARAAELRTLDARDVRRPDGRREDLPRRGLPRRVGAGSRRLGADDHLPGVQARPLQPLGMVPVHNLPEFLVTVYVLILIPGPERAVRDQPRRGARPASGARDGARKRNRLHAAADARRDRGGIAGGAFGRGVQRAEADRRRLPRAARRPQDPRAQSLAEFGAAAATPRSLGRIYREGFYVGATNPKGLVIFTVVLPQFVDRSQGHVTAQLAVLGLICIAIALLSDAAWAFASGTARQWLGSSPRRLERLTAAAAWRRSASASGWRSPAASNNRWRAPVVVAPGLRCTVSAARSERCCSAPGRADVGQARRRSLVDPKGRVRGRRGSVAAAKREFEEELGNAGSRTGRLDDLGEAKQKSDKIVSAWSVAGDLDVTEITSNTVDVQRPPRAR